MRIILSGASGSMGRVISDLVLEMGQDEIVAGLARTGRTDGPYPIYSSLNQIDEKADVLIDFSSYDNLKNVLDFGLERRIPLLLATTGYDEEDLLLVEEAAREIPILMSGNMSLGINMILDLVERLSRGLEGFDIEIVEKHHNLKKDSPSGTAAMLFDAANRGRGSRLHKEESRSGLDLERDENEVGIHAIRGGSIVGEHSVIFAGLDETIEIKHSASSKKIFATGALRAARFLLEADRGLYDMSHILG